MTRTTKFKLKTERTARPTESPKTTFRDGSSPNQPTMTRCSRSTSKIFASEENSSRWRTLRRELLASLNPRRSCESDSSRGNGRTKVGLTSGVGATGVSRRDCQISPRLVMIWRLFTTKTGGRRSATVRRGKLGKTFMHSIFVAGTSRGESEKWQCWR